MKTIYSAKPHKDGYIIKRYEWNGNRYTDIKGVCLVADIESASTFLKGIKLDAEQKGFKTETEKTQKWIFLTIEKGL